MTRLQYFNPVRQLTMNGELFAEISDLKVCLHIGSGEEFETFNLEEATKLRDWLNRAIPSQSDGEVKP
jgi:hypothetical protein